MKKEQILLIVCILAAAFIAYTNLGAYEAVGAKGVSDGKDVSTSLNVQYDPQTGLPVKLGDGRSMIRQRRVSHRPPLPTLTAPKPLPPIWVRLLPSPAPRADHWSTLRERIAIVTATESSDETGALDESEDMGGDAGFDEAGFDEAGSDVAGADDDPLAKKGRDLSKVARLVKKSGDEILCELIPLGALKGQPTWTILEKWPNVQFTVVEYNARNGSIIGSYNIGPEEIEATYATVHLEKTCEKEFHEHRIRQHVRADDRGALIEQSRWVMQALKPRYGQEAVHLAVAAAEQARALKADLATVREVAGLYRAQFDLEGELRVLTEFLNDGNLNDAAALELVAEALDRAGAHGPARAKWNQAAEIGSLPARLGLAENLYSSDELDAALAEFRKVQGSGSADDQSHAFEGEARILLHQGRFQEALVAADRAAQASISNPDVLNTQGAARYYNGRYADAEKSFRAAMNLSLPTETRAQSNLGMALVAQGDLDGAEAAFRACIENDPLNYFDPIAGLGDVLQRKGRLTEANDYFETARVRDPGNPWILLRLGTVKLSDGVPERALELARGLITAAPGCVDGLRLAGLAIRQLDEPDFAEALRHLERAVQKEPTNIELLRQYAAALLAGGRKEDAKRVLDAATATGTGFARRDGRTLALKAYTDFVNFVEMELVREAIANSLRAEIDDEAAEYVKWMLSVITEWDSLRIWTDEFRRSGEKLFGGWKEDDEHLEVRVGVVQKGDEDYVQVVGFARAAADDRRATSFTRTEGAKQIREFEAGVRLVSSDTEFVMHVYTGNLQLPGQETKRSGNRGGAEIAFVVNRDGQVQLYTTAGSGRKGQNLTVIPILDAEGNPMTFPRDGHFHTVRLVRTEHQLGKWQVYLDGDPLGEEQEIGQLAAQRNTQLDVGFQIDADRGTQIEVHIDRVQITRTVD